MNRRQRRQRTKRRRLGRGAGFLVSGALFLVLIAPAAAQGYDFQRAWGDDVVNGGGTGFEICTPTDTCKTGEVGGLGGELFQPADMATDAAGNLYVADNANYRIQKFDAAGNFLRTWGKDVDSALGSGFEICIVAANCQAGLSGGLGGELYAPRGMATDTAGNVYVIDSFNQRVQKFDSNGNFLRTWGKDVDSVDTGTGFEICTVAASCQAGTTGGLAGEFNSPQYAVATDAEGAVYVADAYHRVQKFNSDGGFQRAWGKDVVSGNAEMGFEVCTVATGCQAGTGGELGGEFNSPYGIAAVGAIVYVADTNNDRVQKFTSAGSFERAWGKDVIQTGMAGETGTGFEICTVAANCKKGVVGGLGGELDFPPAVATDAAGSVYVATAHRVQKFDSAGAFLRAWGRDVDSAAGTGFEICTVAANCQPGLVGVLGGELNYPKGMVTDAAGNVYVADYSNHRVQKFTPPGAPPVVTPPIVPPVASVPAAPLGSCAGQRETTSSNSGTPAPDVIAGTPARDVIRTLGGNDLVCGLGGNDLILGGGGKDTLRGEAGEDTLKGGPLKDKLIGGGAKDTLIGGGGPDVLNGGPGADIQRQ